MHNPTPAEKKIILAKLPPAPKGKKWQQYKSDEKIGEGHFVSFRNGGVHLSAPNAGVIGYMGSALSSENSSWKLVRDRSAPVYYRHKDSTSWTAKIHNGKNFVYRDDGVLDKVGGCSVADVRGFLKGGLFVAITHEDFLSRIKAIGLNEDGTKFVPPTPAPRKTRYFASRTRFSDTTAYLRHDGDHSKNATLVRVDGSERADSCISLAGCVGNCKDAWKEITESEAKALVTPTRTELELVKEKLAAAEARIKSLEVTNSELNRKIASAKATLS